ncbi:YopX family protein [Niabella sp. CC-SYL272]|uniref:YopX family protein n=1 Tax=Niabella agricola TaxID=2891571 RepID=UPI001F159F1F|nr:YopX family protein [Niabella agricola]MCF3107300.1 YopX family protein [Niabella agricola]
MKREIIFRGKRVDNGEWVYGCLVTGFDERKGRESVDITYQQFEGASMDYPYPIVTTFYSEVIPETVGQYTGLTDMNGKMIFEGDVFFEEIEHSWGDDRYYFVITWISEWAMFSALSISEYNEYLDTGIEHLDRMISFNIEPDDIEKLHRAGNIHDNPELIK